jgi:hypothetical protein
MRKMLSRCEIAHVLQGLHGFCSQGYHSQHCASKLVKLAQCRKPAALMLYPSFCLLSLLNRSTPGVYGHVFVGSWN